MIQSLSVVVPSNKCINNCKFCCANMIPEIYPNQLSDKMQFYDLYFNDYIKRLEYARSKGIDTVMLTGNCEPQQNKRFLMDFGLMMMIMKNPFERIEMQTTGVMLDKEYLRFLRNHVGVNTISLSVSSFNDSDNMKIIGVSQNHYFSLYELCAEIKNYDFNLRLSLNMSSYYNQYSSEQLLRLCKENYLADQITFRMLYTSDNTTEQDVWINNHKYEKSEELKDYIRQHGTGLEILPYGYTKYNINDMSIVLDDDCMSKELKQDLKYYILRPDCKLYSKWDTKSSLIF